MIDDVSDERRTLPNPSPSPSYTSHHSPSHSFSETRDVLNVVVAGDWLPRSLFGSLSLPFALLKSIYLALYMGWCLPAPVDVIIVDQVAVALPLLTWLTPHLIFYCHFPDMLLSRHDTLLRRMYRWPLDVLEERCMAYAALLLVNSRFTQLVNDG